MPLPPEGIFRLSKQFTVKTVHCQNIHIFHSFSVFCISEKLEKRSCNTLFWSPAGQFIVLADLRNNGTLEFVDTSDFTVMNTSEHFRVSDVEWDPTGRYVVTATSNWKSKVVSEHFLWTWRWRWRGMLGNLFELLKVLCCVLAAYLTRSLILGRFGLLDLDVPRTYFVEEQPPEVLGTPVAT